MEYSDPQNWIQQHTSKEHIRWQHQDHNVWMDVIHNCDHYNEENEQVLRWEAKVTVGEGGLTVGESDYFLCDVRTDEEAKELALSWAEDWMVNKFHTWAERNLDEYESDQ